MKILQQTAKFILYGAILAAVAVVFWKSGAMRVIDEHILLEYTHPKYISAIDNITTRHIPSSLSKVEYVNCFANTMTTYENDKGYTITANKDGSLTYVGVNNSDSNEYIGFTSATWRLPAGSYQLSDSLTDCQTGIPVSTPDFKLTVMARRYHVGGETEYFVIADASDLGTRFFTTDYSQYNDYYAQLIIAPGYTSPGTTIYPMLTTYENRSDDYQPCLLTHPSVYIENDAALSAYNSLAMSKYDYLEMTDEDRELLRRYIRYQAPSNGLWTTIDFQDGTGIYYPDNNPDDLEYGVLNAIGQMSLQYGEEGSIVLADMPLNETTDFAAYLQKINNPDYTILVAIRDDGVNALTDMTMLYLQELGVETELTDCPDRGSMTYYRNSYYAVLNPGQTSVEEVSEGALSYTGTTRDGLHTVSIQSSGWLTEDAKALIQIDGTEYSMNRRGMNFVVYDNATGTVVDNVTFDTNSSLNAYRELNITDTADTNTQ